MTAGQRLDRLGPDVVPGAVEFRFGVAQPNQEIQGGPLLPFLGTAFGGLLPFDFFGALFGFLALDEFGLLLGNLFDHLDLDPRRNHRVEGRLRVVDDVDPLDGGQVADAE